MKKIIRQGILLIGLAIGLLPISVWAGGLADSLRVEIADAKNDSQRVMLYLDLLNDSKYEQPAKLIQMCGEARREANKYGDPQFVARINMWEGWAQNRKGDFEKGIRATEEAMKWYSETNNTEMKVKCIFQLHDAYSQKGDSKKAETYVQEAMDLAILDGSPSLVAMAENNIAITYAKQGNYEKAREYFTCALITQEQNGDSLEIANLANNLGNIHRKLRNYPEAIAYYIRSARIDEQLENFRGLATGYINISQMYREIGDTAQARAYAQSSLDIYEDIQNPLGIVQGLASIAQFARAQGDYETAYNLDRRGVDTCRKYNIENRNLAMCFLGIGHYFFNKKDYREAIVNYDQAEKYFIQSGWKSELGTNYFNLGKSYQALEQFALAEKYFSQGLNLADKSKDLKEQMRAHQFLADFHSMRGNTAKAFEELKQAEQLEDTIYNLENNQRIAEVQAAYDIEKKKRELAEEREQSEFFRAEKALADRKAQFALLFAVIAILLLSSIIYWVRSRAKQARLQQENEQTRVEEKLKREQNQREALEALAHQQSLEIGKRANLLTDLKKELEELRNSNESGNPIEYMHLFKVIENNMHTEEEWEAFKQNFERIHPTFFGNLQERFTDLTQAEIRLCVLLRLGMSQKEIATMINITPDSVKRSRNRLRHKLGLEVETDIREFLFQF